MANRIEAFRRGVFRLLPLLALLVCSAQAQASVVTYTNRAAFEAQLASFTVDSFNSIPAFGQGSYTGPGYSMTGSYFGCINDNGCGGPYPMDDHYMWTYSGNFQFSFGAPVRAFGVDYQLTCCSTNGSIFLDGLSSPPGTAGVQFFGIIETSGFLLNPVIYAENAQYMLIDNVTFSTSLANAVPEPLTGALLGLGLLGLGLSRRMSKARGRFTAS